MERILKTVSWNWDRPSCVLWGHATFTDGSTASVGVPLAKVVSTFELHAAEQGITAAPYVGAVDSVDGFFSGLKRLAKKAYKGVKKAVKATRKTLAKGIKAAGSVVQSKLLKTAVSGLAVAFPAVGGPALAALTAANAAYGSYKKAGSAITAVSKGKPFPGMPPALRQGLRVVNSVKKLASAPRRTAMQSMGLAALRSVQA
jgi:hypothetical protein